MADLGDYLGKRGVTDEQMAEAEARTQAMIDAYLEDRSGSPEAGCVPSDELLCEMFGSTIEDVEREVERVESGDYSGFDFSRVVVGGPM